MPSVVQFDWSDLAPCSKYGSEGPNADVVLLGPGESCRADDTIGAAFSVPIRDSPMQALNVSISIAVHQAVRISAHLELEGEACL
jgi:hypothetical protein